MLVNSTEHANEPQQCHTAVEQVHAALDWAADTEILFTRSGSFTGSDVLQKSQAVRDELLSRGLHPQEFCAYAGTDDLAVLVAPLGITLAGGAFLGLPNFYGMTEWVRFIRESNTRFIICEGYLVSRIREALQATGTGVQFIELAPDGALVHRTGECVHKDHVPKSVDEVVTTRFTSGLTGAPRGILLTHRSWCYDCYQVMFVLGSRECGRYLQLTPNTDVQGIAMCIAALSRHELVTIYQGKPSNGGIVRAIEEERITDLFLPSSQMIKLAASESAEMADLSSLDRFVYGGQKADSAEIRSAYEFLDCELVQVYGAIEAGLLTWLSPEDHERGDESILDSAGRPIPGVRIEIRNPETKLEVPQGTVGHVMAASPGVNHRTLGSDTPQNTSDGWRDTLDRGFFDEQGYLHICGVVRDVILYRGFVMYTYEIESCLSKSPEVAEVVSHPVSHPKDGEHVCIWVRPAVGACINRAELTKQLILECGPWYRPDEIFVVDEIPYKERDGTYDKIALRTRAESQIMASK